MFGESAAVPPGLIAYARFVFGICGDTAHAYNTLFTRLFDQKTHLIFSKN